MNFIAESGAFTWLLWAVAVIWSLYQGIVGYFYGLYIYGRAFPAPSEAQANHAGPSGSAEATGAASWKSPTGKVAHLVYGLHHALLYFTASAFGFLMFQLSSVIVTRIGAWSELSAGAGATLVGTATFAVAGISGALAALLYRGEKLLGRAA